MSLLADEAIDTNVFRIDLGHNSCAFDKETLTIRDVDSTYYFVIVHYISIIRDRRDARSPSSPSSFALKTSVEVTFLNKQMYY